MRALEFDGLATLISATAARLMHIVSPVAGRANVLVVPDLDAGNMLAKEFEFIAHGEAAGIVLEARIPIILTSRAETVRTRVASCALAALYLERHRVSREARGITSSAG